MLQKQLCDVLSSFLTEFVVRLCNGKQVPSSNQFFLYPPLCCLPLGEGPSIRTAVDHQFRLDLSAALSLAFVAPSPPSPICSPPSILPSLLFTSVVHKHRGLCWHATYPYLHAYPRTPPHAIRTTHPAPFVRPPANGSNSTLRRICTLFLDRRTGSSHPYFFFPSTSFSASHSGAAWSAALNIHSRFNTFRRRWR